jgi:hypothetical protein
VNKLSQRDIERAVRAAIKAGMPVGHYEVRQDGTLAIYAQGHDPVPLNTLENELAEWRKTNGSH